MPCVRLLMLTGPPPVLQTPQASPAALAWLHKAPQLLSHSSQKQHSMLIRQIYRNILWAVTSGRIRGWRPRGVFVFMGRGSQRVWVPAGLDLHTATMEVRVSVSTKTHWAAVHPFIHPFIGTGTHRPPVNWSGSIVHTTFIIKELIFTYW